MERARLSNDRSRRYLSNDTTSGVTSTASFEKIKLLKHVITAGGICPVVIQDKSISRPSRLRGDRGNRTVNVSQKIRKAHRMCK